MPASCLLESRLSRRPSRPLDHLFPATSGPRDGGGSRAGHAHTLACPGQRARKGGRRQTSYCFARKTHFRGGLSGARVAVGGRGDKDEDEDVDEDGAAAADCLRWAAARRP